MTKWLIRKTELTAQADDAATRRFRFGRMAGMVGVAVNLLLFAAKLVIGLLFGSVSVVADSINNLSDAASSLVTLFGFRLASAPPDAEHPFGHGRMEYLSALGVSVLIMVTGVQLILSSVQKIVQPSTLQFSWIAVAVLLLSILFKLWLSRFYRKVDQVISSGTLQAAAVDSRNDVLSTLIVLLSILVYGLTRVSIDGYVGVLLALFVIWSGFSILKDTVSLLLGQAPDPALVEEIKNTVLSYEGIIGVHDLMVHSYGARKLVLSFHAEVPSHQDILVSHDIIDQIEQDLMRQYHAVVTIHMDPVDTKDQRVGEYRKLVEDTLRDIDPSLSLHDFRVVFGKTHSNLIFDLEMPFGYKDIRPVLEELQWRIHQVNPQLFIVATPEHRYS